MRLGAMLRHETNPYYRTVNGECRPGNGTILDGDDIGWGEHVAAECALLPNPPVDRKPTSGLEVIFHPPAKVPPKSPIHYLQVVACTTTTRRRYRAKILLSESDFSRASCDRPPTR